MPRKRETSYGALIRGAYEYWFGRRFERRRLAVKKVLGAVAEGYGGGLKDDETTDLFPLVVIDREAGGLVLRLQPSFHGRERFEVSVTARSRWMDPREGQVFPVVHCLSTNRLDRDMGAPWLRWVDTGSATFDARFATRVLPDSGAQHVLTASVRNSLLGLYFRARKKPNLWFESQSNFARIKQTMHVDDIRASHLKAMLTGGYALMLRLEAPLRRSHQPLPGTILVLGDESALCRVCGELVLSRAVRCRQCDTVHHEECWEFTEQCAIYGCGGTAFVPVIQVGPRR